jgi:hypothetical protein
MALQTHIKINGISIDTAYIAIHKTALEKVYLKVTDATKDGQTITIQYQEKDNYIEQGYTVGEPYNKKILTTAVWIGGAGTKEAWWSNDRFNLNHQIGRFAGDLTEAEIYPLLKDCKVPQFEIDLTNSIDV